MEFEFKSLKEYFKRKISASRTQLFFNEINSKEQPSLYKMARIKKNDLSDKKRHRTWQLQEAKARFSELINEVIEDGYHTITKNGRPVAIIISYEEFEKLKTPKNSLGDFLSESPLSDLDIERDRNVGREIDL